MVTIVTVKADFCHAEARAGEAYGAEAGSMIA